MEQGQNIIDLSKKFIKIKNEIVNIECIQRISLFDNTITIHLNNSDEKITTRFIDVEQAKEKFDDLYVKINL